MNAETQHIVDALQDTRKAIVRELKSTGKEPPKVNVTLPEMKVTLPEMKPEINVSPQAVTVEKEDWTSLEVEVVERTQMGRIQKLRITRC